MKLLWMLLIGLLKGGSHAFLVNIKEKKSYNEPQLGQNTVNNQPQSKQIRVENRQDHFNPKTVDYQPQHVHLALGESVEEMVVTWTTFTNTTSEVRYGILGGKEKMANGTSTLFIDGGPEHRNLWMHRVTLHNLLPNTLYYYHCGSSGYGWSSLFVFKTWNNGTNWPVSLAFFGDLGAENAQSLPRLQLETQSGKYHAIVHVGDFAYNMDTDNARVGDEFMRQIEPIAAYVPYMTCPGNHESAYNFSNYRARFSMPNHIETESLYYSFNIGPVHMISINTEAYYFFQYGLKPLSNQYQWLLKDLEEATKPDARAVRPWIIIYGHRPMYCSNTDGDDCTRVSCRTRVGLPVINTYGMEELLDNYGVDLAIWAHEHSYERLWPMYNYTVMNGSTAHPYTDPRGPVHFTTGSAGCKERHDSFPDNPPHWSAAHSLDYGYTRMTIFNNTHLYWEQVSDDKDGAVVDNVWLIRNKHVPYSELRN